LKPRWVKDDSECMGFRIGGINFWYYKCPEPIITIDGDYFEIGKREFGDGEVVQSNYYKGGEN
jgi:hypothetical protein